MVIDRIDILNFKNIPEARIEFSEGVNCLLGRNGMGKSNLLEAIHFACLARPWSTMPESSLIRHGEELMSVNATFRMDRARGAGGDSADTEKVSAGIVRGKGKSLKRNGKEYERMSQHIGAFPIVCVTPADSELVSGAAQERRRMTDMVVSQADAGYLKHLIRYNRSLESRNSLLKQGVSDPILLESVESVMAEAAGAIHKARREWVETIAPIVSRNYTAIAGEGESLTIAYTSALNEATMEDVLKANRRKDAALGYTSGGIHRDDISAELDGHALKGYGSQGQVKSFTIALRLAIFDFLRQTGDETPILLLDDIFDKLDSTRVGRIMELVSHADSFGQIFITDTNREHLDETLYGLSGPKQLISVSEGRFDRI